MNATATLPLFPELPSAGRPDPAAAPLRERAGVEHLDLVARDVLNRADGARLPFDWTINPYRGCEFGCAYCYARDTHRFFDLDGGESFERRIFVKRRAAASLLRQLRKVDLRGQTIALGTATDPYQPAERHYGVTRSLLEVLREAEGLTLWITTKSPLVVRDLDLLVELDRRHAVEIHVTLTTVDAELARRLEPQAPSPAARVRALSTLAEAGLATRVNCMPLMPGINSDEESLAPLLAAARDAGAEQVTANPLFLKGEVVRRQFFGWLERERPHLAPLYRHLYGRRDYLDAEASERLLTTFRRLRLEHGFPRARPGRS
jgi:DNA repair photolyase